jgi:hypothetical protein
VLGGYSAPLKRTRIIERYNEEKNYWEKLSFKINRGVECGFMISNNPDEIIIVGGNIHTGPTNTCHSINL